jgi:uncharacterized protein (DUF2147 family)
MMKKLLAIAAFLLASTTAQAQYTFEYGGRTIHIDPDRGTVSIPGVYDNSGKRSKRSNNEDSDRSRKMPQQPKTDSPAPAPAAATSEPSSATAAVAPAEAAPPAPPAVMPVPQDAAPLPKKTSPAPAVAAAPPSAPPAPAMPSPAAVHAANSPLGVWLTEEKEGKVRIEQCGANICGYAVDRQSNSNGEQVLINMKPGQDKWSGRILDPDTGSTYDSTIALKGSDTLRVQGCAFGGVFCGGQTWTRVN